MHAEFGGSFTETSKPLCHLKADVYCTDVCYIYVHTFPQIRIPFFDNFNGQRV